MFSLMRFCVRTLQLANLGLLKTGFLTAAFSQTFEGDITFVPQVSFSDLGYLLANPTPKSLKHFVEKGYKHAFRKVELIRDRTAIEYCLEKCLLDLSLRVKAKKARSLAFMAITDK